jgi:hypothetical protein
MNDPQPTLDPETQEGINALVDTALKRWFDITGQDGSAESWSVRLGDDSGMDSYDLHEHALALKESRRLDPTGLTTFMLLRGLAEKWLKTVAFTAYELILDPQSSEVELGRLRALRDVLEDPRVTRIISGFQAQLRKLAEQHGMTSKQRKALDKLFADKFSLAYVRRDALVSMKQLRPHQFIQGQPDPDNFKVNTKVYEFWNVNSLLAALRAQNIPGINMVLIRDPEALHSYFIFAVRNGETMTVLTDHDDEAHPLQKSMSRRPDRQLDRRAAKNWFPYQLLDLKVTADGRRRYAEARTALVPIDAHGVPLVDVKDLPAEQFVWAVLMFDLIREQYGKMNVQLPQLSYTGQMVAEPHALVGEHGALVTAGTYKPIEVSPLAKADITAEALAAQHERKPVGHNAWLEERYGAMVPQEALAVVGDRALPQLQAAVASLVPALSKEHGEDFFNHERPLVKLQALNPTNFGTREELLRDRAWLARYNYCQTIDKLAEEEYEREKESVQKWCQERIEANREALIDALVRGEMALESWCVHGYGDNCFKTVWPPRVSRQNALHFSVGRHPASQDSYTHLKLGVWSRSRSRWMCAVTPELPAGVFGAIRPDCPPALATIFGVTVAELPWALQNWLPEEPYTGNSILDRIDPGDWAMENPWKHFDCAVTVCLSRSAYRARRKALGLPAVDLDEKQKKE